MQDPSLALQAAVYAALQASTALDTIFEGDIRVYDRVPQNAAGQLTAKFPYIAIGDDHLVDDSDQSNEAYSAYCNVHVWSRKVGRVEAKTIMGAVLDALKTRLDVEGFRVISGLLDFGPEHRTEVDGLTSHSVATLHYRLGPTA